ncbi:MAG: hypothetical protein AAF682_13815 [Planctomycetota bacterium]
MSTPIRFAVPLAAAALVLSSCSGSSGGGGSFSIVSCTLGCAGSGPAGEGQVSCGIQDVFVNGELRISFSAPVQESTLTVFTLQVTESGTGKTPPADRFVDSLDPRTVVYRPKLTFDSSGSPVFGLTGDSSYTLKLPGTIEDPGEEYVRSVGGAANAHRMLCTVEASLGILDATPGAPTATMTVDTVTEYDPVSGEPSAFALGVAAEGAVDVYRLSNITFRFDDLMNPATLVNPVSGKSNTIAVKIDPDGILSDPSDQQLLQGSYSINLDQDALTTTVVFEPTLGFPSAGSDPVNKRRVIVELAPSIGDLGGNPLSNFGSISFTPEVLLFGEVALSEGFEGVGQEDVDAGGADWGQQVFGALLRGEGGGSGKHGALKLEAGQVVTLSTDSEDFSGIADPGIWSPADAVESAFDGVEFTAPVVTGGVFEFSSLDVATGSQLNFVGSNPARVFVRGETVVRGRISVAAQDGLIHSNKEIFGGVSTDPGPSGARGGDGGRLPTWVNFESLGATTPEDPTVLPPTLDELDGLAGEGVPDNLLTPGGIFGAGGGGITWPQPTPEFPDFHMPVDPTDILGVEWDIIQICQTKMKGSVGGGGAFGLDGGSGVNKPVPGAGFIPTKGPAAEGGSSTGFGLGIGSDPELPQRKLSPEDGWLHGGSGGGGGSGHIAVTFTNGKLLSDCTVTFVGGPASIQLYAQHSAPAGGAGGGAIQLQSGRRCEIDGVVDASGGTGGRKDPFVGHSTGGGGGSGGAILLQGPGVDVGGGFGRLDISGGDGGSGTGASFGGRGGSGLLRIETAVPLDLGVLAPKVAPDPDKLAAVGATPDDVISLGVFDPLPVAPNGLNGAQSCWLRPEGNFFLLTFLEDELDPTTMEIVNPGWDLKVFPNPVSLGEQSFRLENELFGASLEDVLGNELGSSPLVVLFQGARAVTNIDNLCDVDLAGPDADIAPGSLTGWVQHPAELNTFFADPTLRPNLIRFQIIYDDTQGAASNALAAVSELTLRVLPD